jgi:hypothetical protein
MKTLLASLLTLAAVTSAAPPAVPDYRFEQVKRTVTLTSSGRTASPAARGQRALGGDKVQTGWFSYALLASDHYRARFEIFSTTEVTLASDTPGVILSLERGRLHAMFDKVTGNEPRVVKTPGALLAVRGTQYDVEVDGKGETTLNVYEGIVEVRSPLRAQPLLIRAGEAARYGRNEPPAMRQPTRDHDGRPQSQPQGDHDGNNDGHRGTGNNQPPGSPDQHGGKSPQPQPPPPPPPGRGH